MVEALEDRHLLSTFTLQEQLFGDPLAAGARFGAAVACDGDLAVVGAPGDGDTLTGAAYVYVRDDDTVDYWSPSWQPVGREVDDYECRHGMGYSTIGSRRAGVHAETTYFVPAGETLEVWRTRLTN